VLETVRRLLAFIEVGSRLAWVGLVLLALAATALEILAALLIFTVTRQVATPDAPLELPLLGDPRARVPGLTDLEALTLSMAVIAGFFLVRAVVMLTQSYLRSRLAERTGVRLSLRLFSGYLRMPYPFHLQRNSAELIRNVNEAIKDVVDYTLNPMLRLASEGLVLVGLAAALLLMAPLAAALAVAFFGPLMVLLFRVIQPRTAALGRTSHEMGRGAFATLQQSLHGFREIVVLGRRAYFCEEYGRIRGEIARTRYLRQFLGDVPRIALETALIVFVALFMAVSVIVGGTPQESLAVLGLFAYAALRVLPSLNRVVLQLNDLKFGSAAAAAVHADLLLVDASAPSGALKAGDSRATDTLALRRSLRLEHVSYRYPSADRDALTDANVEIRAGESIGVVGPTGGGKSTLVDIIMGLLPPTSGRVLVDDTSIDTELEGWQRQLGVVPQVVYLFDTTLRRNIALGLHDREIDEARVWEAVRLAQLESVVAALPEGLDTVMGERGIRLSGGQRQRVAIARALYRQPSVIVFDEGTSALDNTTEADLLRALASLRGERTLIIVAHRLTTVRECDRILLVEAGRITDSGPFDDLLERSPAFRQLASHAGPPVDAASGPRLR
jgi:ATP-binding cassette, subfamily B, bacterial PglK